MQSSAGRIEHLVTIRYGRMPASPERRIVFDADDFGETCPAPWEWDLKRLAASFVIASRHNGHEPAECRAAAAAVVEPYRDRMRELAEMPAPSW